MAKLRNVHPGEVLFEEFLSPLGISQNRLARDIGVPPRRINEIVHGTRAVTADTALRLARYFGTSEGFWMGLQADYDLEEARRRLGARQVVSMVLRWCSVREPDGEPLRPGGRRSGPIWPEGRINRACGPGPLDAAVAMRRFCLASR